MSNEILVPSLGESITEATVSKWLKQVGEKVDPDEPIVELETDKVNVEVPSPTAGTLSSIQVKEGDTVEVGALLGVIKSGSSKTKSDFNPDIQESKPKANISDIKTTKKETIKKIDKKENTNGTLVLDTLAEDNIPNIKLVKNINPSNELAEEDNSEIQLTENDNLEIKSNEDDNSNVVRKKYVPPKKNQNLSPAVRKIAEEKNIDTSEIDGTGKDGRISKGDLINLMGNTPESSKRKESHGPEEIVKMSRLRITIAKRLKEAQDNAAMLTTFNEVDMFNIMQMRKDYQEDFEKKYSVKLGFMSFFTKASVVALKNFPSVNAEIENDQIIFKNYYNISIAIGTDRGLVVPVLKKADELSFADIERNIFTLSERARKGKITINDLQGGTFTISNGGIYGSMLSTPILNPPQTGILGMHNIVERPVVKNNEIVIRPIMYLALSYDHRIIDGKEAVSFLKTIKECLEEPRRLFLDL